MVTGAPEQTDSELADTVGDGGGASMVTLCATESWQLPAAPSTYESITLPLRPLGSNILPETPVPYQVPVAGVDPNSVFRSSGEADSQTPGVGGVQAAATGEAVMLTEAQAVVLQPPVMATKYVVGEVGLTVMELPLPTTVPPQLPWYQV